MCSRYDQNKLRRKCNSRSWRKYNVCELSCNKAGIVSSVPCCSLTTKPKPTLPPSNEGLQWLLAPGSGKGKSCVEVCAERGATCDPPSFGALKSNDLVLDAYKRAGLRCKKFKTDCERGYNCARWGSPYVHSNHFEDGLCFGGVHPSVASCGQKPIDKHHRRLCPCIRTKQKVCTSSKDCGREELCFEVAKNHFLTKYERCNFYEGGCHCKQRPLNRRCHRKQNTRPHQFEQESLQMRQKIAQSANAISLRPRMS